MTDFSALPVRRWAVPSSPDPPPLRLLVTSADIVALVAPQSKSSCQGTSKMHDTIKPFDPKNYASHERVGYLRGKADEKSLAARELSQQFRNLLEEKRGAERCRRELEVGPGLVQRTFKEEHRRLTELIEVLDADLAEITPRRDRLSAEHRALRAAYTRARDRARELGLPIPADASGDEFAPEPTKQTPYDDGSIKNMEMEK